LDDAWKNQSSFFIQRFGGPPAYHKRKQVTGSKEGPMEIHHAFRITPRGLERWMFHMEKAMDEVGVGESHW